MRAIDLGWPTGSFSVYLHPLQHLFRVSQPEPGYKKWQPLSRWQKVHR